MSTDGSRGPRPGRPEAVDDDDLDRAFGPDTAAVPTVAPRQRVRRGALVGVFVVAAVGVLAVALVSIVGSVQSGVGGVFPRPGTAQQRFDDATRDVHGVQDVRAGDQVKSSFVGYDVVSTVTVDPALPDEQRDAVVRAVRRAAQETSGNGVRVWAIVDLGALQVGVSTDGEATMRRLDLARSVDAIGGVRTVRCSWVAAPSDDPAEQRVALGSTGVGTALEAVVAKATQQTQAAFPGAAVTATTVRG